MFFNENLFRKFQTIFDVEKWLWKSEICNFVTLSPLSEKVQKNFQCNFCDSTSISFIVISFHRIPLTWWNAYYRLPSYLRGRSKTTVAAILAKNTDTLSNRLVPKLCSLTEMFLTSLPCKKSLKYIHKYIHVNMQKIRRNWFSRIFKKHMASLICFFSCV